jgi:hypothetical protein
MNALHASDIEQFITEGFCTLTGAFTAAQARAACETVWRRMESKRSIRASDPSTWPDAYDIEEHLDGPDILACFTDRLVAGIEDLVGPGRWAGSRRWGFWPVNFRFGADLPGPCPTWGWHVDGNWFRHTIDCPRQGLLVIGLFTDVGPGHGGTIVSAGSHRRAARVLADHPAGLAHTELFDLVLTEPLSRFHELTGAAGDVILGHPFLFHTRGFKRRGPPRLISNTEASLREPLRLDRPDHDYSALEESIRRALRDPPAPPGPDAMHCRF